MVYDIAVYIIYCSLSSIDNFCLFVWTFYMRENRFIDVFATYEKSVSNLNF